MKVLTNRKMVAASSALVVLVCLVVVYGMSRIAAAESKFTSLESAKDETILSVSDNIVADTPVKMKFLRGVASKDVADRTNLAGDDGGQLTPLSLASGDL